jgi:hypothetical protein
MPWGRVDPIVALHYISLSDPGVFSLAAWAYDAMRPLNLLPYLVITKSPFQGGEIWYLYKTALVFLAGFSIYLFIYEFLNRQKVLFPALIGLLFVINPVGGWEKINQVLLVSQFSAACIFLSYYLFLIPVRFKNNSKLIPITIGLILNLTGFLMYECAFLLSFGICALIYMKNYKTKDKKQTTYYYLIAPLLMVLYKLFYFVFEDLLTKTFNVTSSASKATLLLNPIDLFNKLLSGYYVSLYDVWKVPFDKVQKHLDIMDSSISIFAKHLLIGLLVSFLVLALVIAWRVVACLYKKKAIDPEYRFYLKSIGVGFVFSFLGYFPLLIAAHYPLYYAGRMHDYANPGLCVVIVSVIGLVSLELRALSRVYAVVLASTLILVAASQYHVMSHTLASQGKEEYGFWFDLTRKMPSLKEDTIIIVNGYPRNGFATETKRETKSYYCNLILLGLYSDHSLKILVFDGEEQYKYKDGSFVLRSKVSLDKVSSPTGGGGYRESEDSHFAMVYTQLYYLTELEKYDHLPETKEYVIDSERVIVFDYNAEFKKVILNEQMSNTSRIMREAQNASIFVRHFLGISDFNDVCRIGSLAECPDNIVKYFARSDKVFNNEKVVFSRNRYRLNIGGYGDCIRIINLTQDGWVTSDGIVLMAPIDLVRRYPVIVLGGNYPHDIVSNLKMACSLISEDLERFDLNALYKFSNGKYDMRVDLSHVIEELPFKDYVYLELKFSEFFVPKSLDISADTRELVLQLSKDLVFEKQV